MPKYNNNLKLPARTLRSNQTDAERLLWSKLRKKQIAKAQFYRQRPILNFIVDFYCPSAKLIIECDGHQHYTKQGLEADINRDNCLQDIGLLTLRYKNKRILTQTIDVISHIESVIRSRL
ncbi:endonuclease domain-containing protein [Psychrobacter lutiphocae]|uniref:endonuclease domain-containing protein n=1 Tax=Psychrobacter lutiphocae TaxID=540500 RepID=UPI000376E916|nr:endonuclease domain-containing protein [Psychrobacter lutiphocae]